MLLRCLEAVLQRISRQLLRRDAVENTANQEIADACEYCDYRIVCGPYEVERTARKRKERLQPLVQLRELP